MVNHTLSTPVAVSRILAEMRLDIETLQAALLHDVIEDCDVTKEDLEEKVRQYRCWIGWWCI